MILCHTELARGRDSSGVPSTGGMPCALSRLATRPDRGLAWRRKSLDSQIYENCREFSTSSQDIFNTPQNQSTYLQKNRYFKNR
jgi:hypothetical protein